MSCTGISIPSSWKMRITETKMTTIKMMMWPKVMMTMMTMMIISMTMVSHAFPQPGVDSHRVDPRGTKDTRCQPCLRSLGTAAIGREISSETIKKIVTSYSQDPMPLRQGTVMGKGVTLCKSRFKVKSVGRSSLDESGSNFDSK